VTAAQIGRIGVLTPVASLVLLSGCGGSGATESSPTSPANTTTTPAESIEPPPATVTTVPGTAEVTLTSGSSHTYPIDCYLHPTSVFLSTPNVPLMVKADGTYTNDVSPRDGGAFMYLIADPPGTQIHGKTIEYTTVPDTASIFVQGDFGNGEGFGGSSDYLQFAELEVDAQGKSGQLDWADTDGSGYTAIWNCE
jgi:hypothetical protein